MRLLLRRARQHYHEMRTAQVWLAGWAIKQAHGGRPFSSAE
jgi:hypothetical protein